MVSCEHGTGCAGVTKTGTWLSRGAPDNRRYVGYFLVFDCAPHVGDTWRMEIQLHIVA